MKQITFLIVLFVTSLSIVGCSASRGVSVPDSNVQILTPIGKETDTSYVAYGEGESDKKEDAIEIAKLNALAKIVRIVGSKKYSSIGDTTLVESTFHVPPGGEKVLELKVNKNNKDIYHAKITISISKKSRYPFQW
jgi:hypothetical protein